MNAGLTDKRLRRRPLFSREVRDAILAAILNGELNSGDRVVETRWARDLGVSQSPVREALRELEMLGLVEIRPYRGAFVRAVDKAGLVEAYDVRRGLESVAIESAVEKITDRELAEIRALLEDMRRAVENGQLDLYSERDSLFHEKILLVSGNKLLHQLWTQCKIREYARISVRISRTAMNVLAKRHNAMHDALAKRDAAAGVAAVDGHFAFLIKLLSRPDGEKLCAARGAAARVS